MWVRSRNKWRLKTAEALRNDGINVVLHAGGGSFKSQMKKADRSLAKFAMIIGEDEVANQTVTLKAMSQDVVIMDGKSQITCQLQDAINAIKQFK